MIGLKFKLLITLLGPKKAPQFTGMGRTHLFLLHIQSTLLNFAVSHSRVHLGWMEFRR